MGSELISSAHPLVHPQQVIPETNSDPIPLLTPLPCLHVGFGFASGALATVVLGTGQSRGVPMECRQVMGDGGSPR